MPSYTFRECTLTKLDKTFGLRKISHNAILDQWLKTKTPISKLDRLNLTNLQQLLQENADGWNEQELLIQFIGPLFSLVHYTEPYRFNLFAQRKIAAVIPSPLGDVELYGEPDGILATGYREPELPFFAFTEYKKQLDPTGDPAGQTLAPMLVAQHLNSDPIAIYGCYVVGREWFFMVLEGSHYVISNGHNALQKSELEEILRILKTLKVIVASLFK